MRTIGLSSASQMLTLNKKRGGGGNAEKVVRIETNWEAFMTIESNVTVSKWKKQQHEALEWEEHIRQ